MDRRFALLPLLALAGTSLSGCVAIAIPALAGSAMVGSRVIENEAGDDAAVGPASVAATVPAPAPVSAPAPTPIPAAPPPRPVLPPPTPAQAAAAPPTVTTPPPPLARPVPVTPAPAPMAAPTRAPAIPATGTAAAAAAAAAAAPTAYPDPARPLAADQLGFARFVRFGQASAVGAKGGDDLLSAMLSDPVALDGQRRRCTPGEQLVAVIDLEPGDAVFSPPANPGVQPGLALGLAVLREAGVEIAWMSDLSTTQSGLLRAALEQSGLDPRGEDIIALRRDEADTKQQRRDSLAGIACIVAIAGDERGDFDERYKYLRSPEAGAGLEPIIGNGWFLITPLIGN